MTAIRQVHDAVSDSLPGPPSKRGTPDIRGRLVAIRPDEGYLCSIVTSERLYGARKNQDPPKTGRSAC
jgi:hypothetical protein